MTNKKHLLNIAVMTAILAAGIVSNSCKKIDPEAAGESFPAAAFTLSAVEDRYAPEPYRWTISKNGVTDSVSEELDEMYVTRYNTVTLEVKPTGTGFQGVNVRSSNPASVRVTQLDQTHYDLSYLKEGESDITVWNGGRKDEVRTTFHVKAERAVYPTAAVFIFDEGTEREKEIKCTEWFIDEKQNFESYYQRFTNYHKELDGRDLFKNNGFHIVLKSNEVTEENAWWILPVPLMHTIKLIRIEPENTSFNYLYVDAKEYNEHLMENFVPDISPKWAEYLESEGLRSDWGEPWNGYAKDFDKVCYYAPSNYCLNNPTLSLCEMTLQSKCPTGSSKCQTALLMQMIRVNGK